MLLVRPASRSVCWSVSFFPRRCLRIRANVSKAAPKPGKSTNAATAAKPATRKRRTTKTQRGDDSEPDATTATANTEFADARLPPLALRPLRDVALLCGRNYSGTKATLRADLWDVLSADAAQDAKITRLLSIDMGVRNLAYCLLDISKHKNNVPELVAWERLSLIGDNAEDGDQSKRNAPGSSTFSPPAMAAVAARLVHDRLLPLAPSHVIIERQRFRSGGAAAVLEWTVRVNSLEAMLHGILAYGLLTKNAYADGNSIQDVQAISPQRVAQYLLRGGISGALPASMAMPTKATKEKDIKDIKESFVANALQSTNRKPRKLVSYSTKAGNHVHDMVEAFLVRWEAKQKKTRSKPTKSAKGSDSPKLVLSKIDDLADCVTQGLVWLEWERNKQLLCKRGAEALLEDTNLPSPE